MSLKTQLEVMKMSCGRDTRQLIALYMYSLDERGEVETQIKKLVFWRPCTSNIVLKKTLYSAI